MVLFKRVSASLANCGCYQYVEGAVAPANCACGKDGHIILLFCLVCLLRFVPLTSANTGNPNDVGDGRHRVLSCGCRDGHILGGRADATSFEELPIAEGLQNLLDTSPVRRPGCLVISRAVNGGMERVDKHFGSPNIYMILYRRI